MFWAIFAIVIVMILVFIVYSEYQARIRAERDSRELRARNTGLNAELKRYRDHDIERRCKDNYEKGLYDGRTSDTLYRSIVNKYRAKEQFTIIMNGEEERTDEDEARGSGVY